MLVDANLLLYAVNPDAPEHRAASTWLDAQFNGVERVGLPWLSLAAFFRVSTNPRAFPRPLDSVTAWARVSDWLAASTSWVPQPGQGYANILGRLVSDHNIRGNLFTDAQLAALAIEHGQTLCSADTDFARFPEVRWVNPLAAS